MNCFYFFFVFFFLFFQDTIINLSHIQQFVLRTGTQTHLSTQEFRQSPSHAYIINILLYDQSYLIPCTHNIYSVYWPHGTYFAIHLFPISTDLFFYILVYIICFNKDFFFFFFTSNQDTRLNYFNEYLICFLFFLLIFLPVILVFLVIFYVFL